MKKSLLALAVLGAFAGAASAQSSVTIYGLVDLAITKGNGGTAPNVAANGLSEAYIMKQSSSSRLGFRGNEDMGGGLSAQFQLEQRFTPDDGVESTPLYGGRSFVQFTHSAAGSIYMGREYGPEFWPAVKTDPFGWDGVAQISSMQYAGYSTALNGASSVRTSNTAGYRGKFGPVSAQLAVSLSEGSATAGRVVGGNVEYAGGPIYVGVGFSNTTDGTNDGHRLVNIGGAYDLGMVRPILYYGQSKVGPAGNVTGKDFMVALTAPIGPGKLKAAWSRLDPNDVVNNDRITKIGLGYDYSLSKRSNVYVDYGRGTSQAPGTTTNQAVAVGMKHVF
jgi:predicted porin